MHILMFTNTFTPHVGGVARSVEQFTAEYRHRGHRVLVVAPEFSPKVANESGVVRMPAIQNFNGSDFSVAVPIPGYLNSAIADFEPDIVHSHLADAYAAMDVFAFASQTETQGMVLTEAMAAGLPVVAVDAPECARSSWTARTEFHSPMKIWRPTSRPLPTWPVNPTISEPCWLAAHDKRPTAFPCEIRPGTPWL